MLQNINPITTSSWENLERHFNIMKNFHMKDMFSEDSERFSKYTFQFEDILVDLSKNIINENTIESLLALAEEAKLKDAIDKMFSGEKINKLEDRAVLHVALRNRSNEPVFIDGKDVMPDVNHELKKIKSFSEKIINGGWKGFTGKKIKDIVNIGVGGSNLGPVMVTEALKAYQKKNIQVHFMSNIDGAHVMNILNRVDPETTLFMVSSKSFTTLETMTNAETSKRWFLEKANNEEDVVKHFVAISADLEAVQKFGIPEENFFKFWDWVGGRYSLWSSIGLSIACSIGFDKFKELLEGGHAMDQHFREVPLNKNIPVLMALIGIWYTNFFGAQSEAILPYSQNMCYFPTYFQQAIWKAMENGWIGMAIL